MVSATPSATTARRRAKALRPTRSVCATSPRLLPGCAARWSASRARMAASASGVRADSVSSRGPATGSVGCASGASSWITWALVPPTPNELTPARRGAPSRRGQSARCALTWNGVPSKSIAGLALS